MVNKHKVEVERPLTVDTHLIEVEMLAVVKLLIKANEHFDSRQTIKSISKGTLETVNEHLIQSRNVLLQ